jgi:hypothetical protein
VEWVELSRNRVKYQVLVLACLDAVNSVFPAGNSSPVVRPVDTEEMC